ncbi:CRISPR-associated protein Csx11 [Methanothermobacter sp. EMTCatA1]|uniref:CRISPR-associated protein Csx11 n=1 Tax=Methanothermobacter sp. EMTCatA1 TaxID=2017966 RepID=UPI00257986E7|nr:CRISPR-associated protein Csx11 [Methanothermobacter sp. EMTCatA1]
MSYQRFWMVMGMSNIKNIRKRRKEVLLGEIGALLHDIGKLHPDFIGTNSIEKTPPRFFHANIDDFLKTELISALKAINGESIRIYNIISEHHRKNNVLQGCDRKDSADDKGIVRRKQSITDTVISSPFGYPKEKIHLNCLQKEFDDLQTLLVRLFKDYISGVVNLSLFRRMLMKEAQVFFSHGLGETRIPSNDVTLWDHSYSTASRFKSLLVAKLCGADIKDPELRIFGIFWNGIEFINKGRKIAEIKARKEIIERIKEKLKGKFEDEIPVGNSIYEDINGICFTFPEFERAEELANQCAKEACEIVLEESENELWPFFTLSKPSKTLTVLASELKFASSRGAYPKITPALFIDKKQKKIIADNPEMPTPQEGEDICPLCRLRAKPIEKERCEICSERIQGRLANWSNKKENTIWIDEVADKNNRIALIALNFDLDKWFDGTMAGTIYSQTYKDWKHSKKWEKKNVKKNANSVLNGPIEATKDHVYKILNYILENEDSNEEKAAKLLDTFFEEEIGLNKSSLQSHFQNIRENIGADLDKENLATYLFTQNPSPARLYRIWKETEEFFDLLINKITDIYAYRWKRIGFSIDTHELKGRLKEEYKNIKELEKGSLIIKISGLDPETLLVFHDRNGEFYTIESLGKFKFKNKVGEEAVKEALKQGIKHLAPEDEPEKNLIEVGKTIKTEDNLYFEKYYPLIEINRSPLSLRFIVPALDSVKIIEMIAELYNKRFEKVLGKLPLNLKLLVAKRKFPLYILLEAEKRMLKDEEFKKQTPMDPWWSVERLDEHYNFYPIKPANGEKYTLDDLSRLSRGKIFYLYPGYFDFELLSATTDRYNICYEGKKRGHEDHRLFSGRPLYFHQIPQILELWDLLSSNLSNSQINFIEKALTSKLREWKNVKDANKENTFRIFAETTLKDAFGHKWDGLREENRFFLISSSINMLLLDTINLFTHVTGCLKDE